MSDLLANTAATDAARADVVGRLSAPGRHYHGLDHVATLWARHREHGASAGFDSPEACRLVGSVIAFHDAVYVPGRRDNETRSAELWRAAALPGLPQMELDWIAGTIECTANHLAASDAPLPGQKPGLRLWILDLDLTPLGDPPARFAANRVSLDRELGLGAGDSSFLRRVMQAPRIYRSPVLAELFEAQARRNIAAALGP